MSITPFFSGEIQLAGWNETHNSGSKVSFWLPDPGDLDPFRSATIRKGNRSGQRFACVLVEIGDDEQPIEQIKPDGGVEPTVPRKGGELAKWAGILSNDPVFWEWLNTLEHQDINSEALAAEYIRDWCVIDSRAELDHNQQAAKMFRHIMGEFDDWKNGGKAA